MTGRPERLWPLFSALTGLDGVGPKTASAFAGLGVEKPRDLLFTLPHSGIDRTRRSSVAGLISGAVATVVVEVLAHQPAVRKGRPTRVTVRDEGVEFQLVFFHARGDYLSRILPVGARRVVSGKVEFFDGIAQIVHPDHILPEGEASAIPVFEPVYPMAAGLTQKVLWKASRAALALAPDLPEWCDPALIKREGWPSWTEALASVHGPASFAELAAEHPARQRIAYDEFLAHQLTLALARATQRKKPGRVNNGDGRLRKKVESALPYTPTGSQMRAVDEIAEDMASATRMNRLLQGDVGAGKTIVALMALMVAVEAGGQGALMAPTEILARQHKAGLEDICNAAGVTLEILTGRDKGAQRAAKLSRLVSGDIDILIGTHAVFQKDVSFKDLRLAVIDEQHRFGVAQRMQLGSKGARADVLVMTATPIPRSLALAQYGDMDVSVLDEKPPGRKPIKTVLVSSERYDEVTASLARALADGRQAYWVCPLVEESELTDLAAAEARFKALRSQLGEGVVGLVHGQMSPADKDDTMARFVSGELRLLVATTVIEVGVDVPSASIMVIERAEHFGLAQLHQLRGRVGRGAEASSCTLLYQAPLSENGRRRLEILRETEDGFRISEEDLLMRGAGDMIGTAQSGLPRFRVADLERQAGLMKTAQSDARNLLETDPGLTSARGEAVRLLLWLMEQDRAISFISIG